MGPRLLILALAFTGGCAPDRDTSASSPAQALQGQGGLVLDPASLAPGDSVGPFRVATADFRRAYDDSVWVGTATFTGEVELAGLYATHHDGEYNTPCLYVADSLRGRLPRLAADERDPWLCFPTSVAVVAALGPPPQRRTETTGEGGVAVRVVVNSLLYVYSFSDAFNEATFVRVLPAPAP